MISTNKIMAEIMTKSYKNVKLKQIGKKKY